MTQGHKSEVPNEDQTYIPSNGMQEWFDNEYTVHFTQVFTVQPNLIKQE